MKSLAEQLACARRELALRKNVYPKRVGDGKMKGDQARHETDCMTAIVATLEKCVLLEEVSNEMKAAEEARERAQQKTGPAWRNTLGGSMTQLDKPVSRKTEADTPHGINPNLVITLYPRGVIGIREHRRPLHTEKRTTAGNLYQELTVRFVLKAGRLEREYRRTMTRKEARARARKECGL